MNRLLLRLSVLPTFFVLACSQTSPEQTRPESPNESIDSCHTVETSYAKAQVCLQNSPESRKEVQRQSNLAPVSSKTVDPQVASVETQTNRLDIFPPLNLSVRLAPGHQTSSALNRPIEISIRNGLGGIKRKQSASRISDPLRFFAQLQKELPRADFPNTFSCPDKIIFRVNKRSITFPLFDLGEICIFNEVLPASIPLWPFDLADVTNEFINQGEITATVHIPLAPPVVSQSVLLELRPNQVLDLLIKELRSNLGRPLTFEVTNRAIGKVAQRISQEMNLPITTRLRHEMENTILRAFFVPFPCDEHEANWCAYLTPPRDASATSLLLKSYHETPGRLLKQVQSNQRDLLSRGPMNFQLLADDSDSLSAPKDREASLRAVVRAGDLIEFEITSVHQSHLATEARAPERIPNLVCLDPYKNCLVGKWKCVAEGTVRKSREIHHGCERLRNLQTKAMCYLSNPPASKQVGGPATIAPIMCDNPDAFKSLKQAQTKDGYECIFARSTTVEDEIPICDTLPYPALPKLPTRSDKPQSITCPTGEFEWVDLDERPLHQSSTLRAGNNTKRRIRVEIYKPQFEWVCTQQSETTCDADKWQDQWTEVTTFSQPLLRPNYTPLPLTHALLEFVRDSLAVKVTDSYTPTVCALRDLLVFSTAPDLLKIELRNTPSCRLFSNEEQNERRPLKIALINRLSQKQSFACGHRVDSWNGKRTYVCNLPDGKALTQQTTIKEDQNQEPKGIWADYFSRFKVFGTFNRIPKEI